MLYIIYLHCKTLIKLLTMLYIHDTMLIGSYMELDNICWMDALAAKIKDFSRHAPCCRRQGEIYGQENDRFSC